MIVAEVNASDAIKANFFASHDVKTCTINGRMHALCEGLQTVYPSSGIRCRIPLDYFVDVHDWRMNDIMSWLGY